MDKGGFGEKAERRRAGSSWNRDNSAWRLGASKEPLRARSPVRRRPAATDSSVMNAAAAEESEAVKRLATNGDDDLHACKCSIMCVSSRSSTENGKAWKYRRVSQNIDASQNTPDDPRVELQVQKEEGFFRVKGSVETVVDPDTLYGIITDYNSTPRVFRNVDRVEVEQRGNEKLVTQFLHWNFLLWSGNYDVKMKVKDDPQSRSISYELDQPGFLKVFNGSWTVEPLASEGVPATSKLILNQRALPSFFPPGPLAVGAGTYASRIMSSQVRSLLTDVATEASEVKKNSATSP